jgi:hypothetical protein
MDKNQVIIIYYSDSAYTEVLDIFNIEQCRRKECELLLIIFFVYFKCFKSSVLIVVLIQLYCVLSSDFQQVVL